MKRPVILLSVAAAMAFGASGSAFALTAKECSVKYQAAKQANTLGGQKWNDFRKAECGTTASAAPSAPATAAAPAAAAPATPAPAPAATATRAAPAKPAPSMAASGPASYPAAVDPKYASESAGKARMHTCLDSYKAAKASNTLGGMHWIDKGGGYYSTCNTKLKGA